ncbi:hypothetical protein [Metasolibacillus meyeri]|uniref:hypothetical protein n=1 Tax=Metasolibacillus meyeri TaxID=1071052 RepID=UPI000D3187DE|nr:hypothetical protein [Metasolibacillus meyeri]
MDKHTEKLFKLSKWAYFLLYVPLFGYALNPDLYIFWLAVLFIGGWIILLKNRLIKKNMKTKIVLTEVLTTLGLIFVIFSNLMPIVKQLIVLITATIIIYKHTKLIFSGNLT